MPVFDIETGPRIDIDLSSLVEPFDESEVKTGNLKDPEKIAAKIEEARAAHVANAISKAALSPRTGCVLAIGLKSSRGVKCLSVDLVADNDPAKINEEESTLLSEWWSACSVWKSSGRKLIAHHISFDLPFLIRRSWILGVPVPAWVLSGRYRPDCFIDTEERWLCRNRFGYEKSNLDFVASAFGIEGKYKPEPMTLPGDDHPSQLGGATFHRFFRAGGEYQEQALAYLVRDLDVTYEVALRMGLEVD